VIVIVGVDEKVVRLYPLMVFLPVPEVACDTNSVLPDIAMPAGVVMKPPLSLLPEMVFVWRLVLRLYRNTLLLLKFVTYRSLAVTAMCQGEFNPLAVPPTVKMPVEATPPVPFRVAVLIMVLPVPAEESAIYKVDPDSARPWKPSPATKEALMSVPLML